MEDHLLAKIVSMCLLGGVSLFLGVLPIWIVSRFGLSKPDEKKSNGSRTAKMLTALNCFGAGVILTTCFTHMLPEVNAFLEINYRENTIHNSGLALGEILLICGFLMIYVVEEVAHFFLGRMKNSMAGAHSVKSLPTANTSVNGSTLSFVDEKPYPKGDFGHDEIPTDLIFTNLDESAFQIAFRGFFVILALALHAVFEGIAMGLSTKATFIWYLCFAIAAHKYIISFCVGLQMATAGMPRWLIVIYMATFSLITPIGIGIGIALTETSTDESNLQNAAVSILQGLAAGTLLYVVFFEVLEKERAKKANGLLQVTFIVLGFTIMVLVQLIEGEHHHGADDVCSIIPEEVFGRISQFNYSEPVNVTCVAGNFTIL